MLRAFLSAPSGILGLVVLALLVVDASLAPQLFSERARAFDAFSANQQPSAAHWLGTDGLGRDLFLRLLVATRTSLVLALIATLLSAVIGYTLGAAAAVMPGPIRTVVLRTIDALFAFPFLLVAIFMAAIIGPSVWGTILGVAIPASFGKARVASSLVMAIAGREFVAAARVVGVRPARMVFRYLLPNIGETLALTTTVSISASILAVSSLSFLGLGIQPPDYDLGRMLTEGVNAFYSTPMAALGPAVVIAISALAFGFVGEALARALNPTLWTTIQAARTGQPVPRLQPTDFGIPTAPEQGPKTMQTAQPPQGRGILEVANLSVQFPGPRGLVSVVNNISFSMARGDMLGVVGESGSGKTMTSLAIAQLVPYPARVSGTIALDGQNLSQLPTTQLRKLLGTRLANVFQDPMSSLNPALKIGTQLTEGLQEHRGLNHREAMAVALDGLKEVNIPIPGRQLERHPHELSGGMRQRVMIAMGLINEPDLLIADEPTTALDVTVQAQIMELLADINARHGTAVILVSHNIGLVSQNCQRALVMYAGRIVEDLSIEQMKSEPLHPYTRALIGAIPDMSRPRDQRLEAIAGQAADTANLPTGCPFHPRCPVALERCSVDDPPLLERPDGRRVACLVANADLA